MLKVWVIWDDCPNQFGEKKILRAYMTRTGARKFVKKLKRVDEYTYQYVEIIGLNVKVE